MPPRQQKTFKHEQLITFKIPKKQGQERLQDQVEVIQQHMEVAEHNFTAVLQAAVKISRIFSNFQRVTTFDLEIITNLVHDLRTIFRLLRSRLRRDFPDVAVRGQQAAPGDQIPDRIRRDVYTCLCPLTMLLRAVAQCFSDLKVAAPSNAGNNAWGTIEPLHKLLSQMEKNMIRTRRDDSDSPGAHIGFATCIMLHERNSRYLVTSTSPRYGALKALDNYGRGLRIAHLARMKAALSDEVQDRVETLETYSENVAKSERWRTTKPNQPYSGPSATLAAPEAIMGHNAAFRSTGAYMTACLLDHLRFQIGKTASAAQIEKAKRYEERDVHGTTSCAEWELYITLLHNPDPNGPYAPQFIAVTYGSQTNTSPNYAQTYRTKTGPGESFDFCKPRTISSASGRRSSDNEDANASNETRATISSTSEEGQVKKVLFLE